MKRNDKKFYNLRKKEKELQKQKDRLEKVELKSPYQKGWNIQLTLSEEALRRSDGERMLFLLRKFCPKPKVLDPDGWDRKNFQFSWHEEKITFEEYKSKVMISTCSYTFPKEENGI